MSDDPLKTQVAGSHYKSFKIQPVEFAHANGLPFVEGCIIKYVCRHKTKGGKQDLLKARHFIDLLIKLEYPDDERQQAHSVPDSRCAEARGGGINLPHSDPERGFARYGTESFRGGGGS